MKERDLLRQANTPDLPDPEQVRRKILHGNTQKARRKTLHAVLPAAACVALLLTATVLFSQWNSLSRNSAAVTPDPTAQAEQVKNPDAEHARPALAPEIHFNELGSEGIAANMPYYDPKETYEKQLTFSQLVDYLGRDIRPASIPKDLHSASVRDMAFTMIYKNDGSILYDSFSFYYQEKPGNPDYDPLERKLVISVSKMQLLRDCLYAWPEDTQETYLNGHAVQLGKCKMPYGPYTVVESGDNTPAGYYDLFVADFQFAGLDYQVVADNLTEAEFVETLSSMLPLEKGKTARAEAPADRASTDGASAEAFTSLPASGLTVQVD